MPVIRQRHGVQSARRVENYACNVDQSINIIDGEGVVFVNMRDVQSSVTPDEARMLADILYEAAKRVEDAAAK